MNTENFHSASAYYAESKKLIRTKKQSIRITHSLQEYKKDFHKHTEKNFFFPSPERNSTNLLRNYCRTCLPPARENFYIFDGGQFHAKNTRVCILFKYYTVVKILLKTFVFTRYTNMRNIEISDYYNKYDFASLSFLKNMHTFYVDFNYYF